MLATDCRSYWKDYRAGLIDIEEIWKVNDELVPTVGVRTFMTIQLTLEIVDELSDLRE